MNTGSGRTIGNSLIRNEKGVILVEFAFCFTVLIILFLGLLTFSFVYRDYVSIQKVAREGAREAVITGKTDMAYSKARQAAWLWGLKPENLTITLSKNVEGTRTLQRCDVTYRINLFNYTFPALTGQPPLEDFNINTRATYSWRDFKK